MKKDAELHAAEDKKKQEAIETKNLADAMVYTAEKTLVDNKEKIADDMRKEAEIKIAALKEILKTDLSAEASAKADNIDDIKTKTKELSELMQKIGAELYKQNPQGGPNAGQTPPNPNNEVNEKSEDEKPQADEGEVKEKR